jgi:hypothetical protein
MPSVIMFNVILLNVMAPSQLSVRQLLLFTLFPIEIKT